MNGFCRPPLADGVVMTAICVALILGAVGAMLVYDLLHRNIAHNNDPNAGGAIMK